MCKNIMIFPHKPRQITAFLTHIRVLISAMSFDYNKSTLIQHKKWTSTCAFLQAMRTQTIRNFFNFSFKGIQLTPVSNPEYQPVSSTAVYSQLAAIQTASTSCKYNSHIHIILSQFTKKK